MDCRIEKNIQECPCTYPDCPRKGVCCECIEHHKSKDQLPACYFSSEAEATYDRSYQKFLEDLKNRGKI